MYNQFITDKLNSLKNTNKNYCRFSKLLYLTSNLLAYASNLNAACSSLETLSSIWSI